MGAAEKPQSLRISQAFRRFYVPIFGTLTILIKSGALGFRSVGNTFRRGDGGGLAQGVISRKIENGPSQGD